MAGYLLAAALLLCMQGWSSGVERGQVVLLPSSTSNGMSYVQVYERSSCKPREVLVNILKEHPQETAHFFKPSCVLLQRCTGCCNDDSLKCFAVTKRSIRLQIIRVSNTQTSQTEWMDFTEHLTCECRLSRPRRVNSAKNRKSRKRKRSHAEREPSARLPFI